MAILYVGIDLAKNACALQAVDEAGRVAWCARACHAPGWRTGRLLAGKALEAWHERPDPACRVISARWKG